MKISKLSRLYIKQPLNENKSLVLSTEHLHYLQNVMRLKAGRKFRVFNEADGEFIAVIDKFEKKEAMANILQLIREPIIETPLTLAISIIKPDKMFDAINMAVQIGVTEIIPIIAERSQSQTINSERLAKIITEAAEQSERLSVPKYRKPIRLTEFISSPGFDMIIYASEAEDKLNLIHNLKSFPAKLAYLVGPEGGFSETELKALELSRAAHSVSLGSNILRAETAVAAGLAQIMLMRAKCRI